MTLRRTAARAALFILLSAGLAPALAQQAQPGAQQGQGQPGQDQGQSGQNQNQNQGQSGQDGAGTAQAPDGTLPEIVAALSFEATGLTDEDLISAATAMAGSDRLARVEVAPAPDGTVSGQLVFEDVEAFSQWREGEMAAFFEPLGGLDAVTVELLVYRPELLRTGDPEALLAGLEGLSIRYANTGNHSAGDADIDAVTVVCTGAGANCTPSN